MTTRLLVGDVFKRMAELDDHSFDLIVTSPPFLALRSYLPDDHPDKDKEIGSEATPADHLDTLLALTAEWRRLLAPHGSLAVELGDTYAGSGGAGGDYDNPQSLRAGQPKFKGSALADRKNKVLREDGNRLQQGPGWPLDLSLTGIPTLYAWSLAYGRNLLTGQESPAGRWRVRNLKPWIRSNPPVGSLGTKNQRERSATSYITVACTGASRWFDLDAVRTPVSAAEWAKAGQASGESYQGGDGGYNHGRIREPHPGGAPPLDWWHPVDAVIDAVIDQRAGKANGSGGKGGGGAWTNAGVAGVRRFDHETDNVTMGARGVHIRRALTEAGYLTNGDFYDVSPRGYAGAHYAVWPPELVRLLIDEMCPRRVCAICGVPSRRITQASYVNPHTGGEPSVLMRDRKSPRVNQWDGSGDQTVSRVATTLGWSDCGCPGDHWRPGRILDPFSGSGTTLAVASGMGRDSVGIDLDPRNADLTLERVGMFLEVDYGTKEVAS